MDATHIHLILNHFPISGMIFSIPLLLVAWLRKSEVLGRAGMITVFVTGFITIPTFLTGDPAEELIEHLPGISEKIIKIHEEAAEKAIWFVGAAALVALIGLFLSFRNRYTPKWAVPLVMILSVCSIGVLGWTNNLGGAISHPEIRRNKLMTTPVNIKKHENEGKE